MSSRDLISLVLFALPAVAAAASAGSQPTPTMNDSRQIMGLDQGWRFHFGAAGDPQRAGFDDSTWERVDVPHTWNAADGTTKGFRRGPGWYRLHFLAPAATGRRSYLRFDGVSTVSTVWLNGQELGTHWSATSAFCVDATAALKPSTDNVLVVLADSTWRDDVPPREGDFTIFGGIYRHVALITASPLAVDQLDHAGPGVYLTTPEVTSERGVARARIRVSNAGAVATQAAVVFTVLDATGVVAGAVRADHVAAPGVTEVVLELTVAKPHRWNGRIDPYLYQAVVEITTAGQLSDRIRQPFGFRTFRVDPVQGFILNGRPYDLHGVNLHQDREGRGWAVSPEDREEDFRLLVELGCTFVRFAHYQHDQQAYDLCDRLGLIAWAEHGLVNTLSDQPAFAERCVAQLTDLIRQSYNHPAIIVWGIGNEVQAHRYAFGPDLLRRLSRVVKAEDATRPSTLATCYNEVPGTYDNDLIAHNQYHGWYHDTLADFPKWLEAQQAEAPDRCQGMSEFGAGAGASIHRADPKAQDHSEEWQALFHEAYWRVLRERPWVWCKAVWQMFDAASGGRNEGERSGVNDKGLVTRDRKIRKDAFYWYKANWTAEPLVYITSRRFTPRNAARTEVKVYSNCEEVELTLNGRSLGPEPVVDHIARWRDVELAPGDNRIEAHGRSRGAMVVDRCDWTLQLPP
jgi:beta-galactosidase